MLTQKRLKELLNYDLETGVFIWRVSNGTGVHEGDIAGWVVKGYRYIQIEKTLKASRLAWLYTEGEWPKGVIDHINGIKNDDRRVNLQDISHRENLWKQGMRVDNTSGYKGVSWCKSRKKWRADITVNFKQIFLGYFKSVEEAYAAYCIAAFKYFGEFANVDCYQQSKRDIPQN